MKSINTTYNRKITICENDKLRTHANPIEVTRKKEYDYRLFQVAL